MPATRRRASPCVCAPPVLPRGSVNNVARTWVVSWLRAALLAFPTAHAVSGGDEQALIARYSGGAAPALHRFPCPALAVCESIV
jgi:hypothetical protein